MPMSFKPVVCPTCGASYQIPEERAGETERCGKCGTTFQLVPESGVGAPTADADLLALLGPQLDEDLPVVIGRYKVLKRLGNGAMGVVYLADDHKLNRRVALKVPLKDFARFLREARIAAQFHHDNFCPIHDIGEENGVPFLVMAFIEGKTLARLIISKKPWESRKAVELIHTLALALAEAHRKGVIHRDLKPANIMVDPNGRLFLMDFGLAHQADLVGPVSTADGTILGTATYMPPEQAKGRVKELGPRSDLYSLGVIFYELLTGRPPFEGEFYWQVLAQVASTEPPPPPSGLNPAIDPALEAIVLKAMAKKPEDRFDSMDEFAGALRGWLVAPRLPDPIWALAPPPQGILTNSIGMKLALIPAGEFLMGSDETDPDAQDDEKVNGKKHKVRITKPFSMGTTQVTVGQFRQFVERTSYKTEAERGGKGGFGWNEAKGRFEQDPKYTWRFPGFQQADDHPVVLVSWNDGVAFCEWLSQEEGQTYRLPTEAEWEYTCRAGRTTRYFSGDDPELLVTVGNVADGTAKEKFPDWTTIKAKDGYVFTSPVGSFRPNDFGLFDMHGNVWEWCSDWYDSNYYSVSPPADPPGSSNGSFRVIRGGSWSGNPRNCRSAGRVRRTPGDRLNDLGFRVARVPSGQQERDK